MQINVEHIDLDTGRSFRAYRYDFPEQIQAFHTHQEYELAVVEGTGGVLYCGAMSTAFSSGDLFLFGSRLPHRFIGPPGSLHLAPARVVQFRSDALGAGFFQLPENASLRSLLAAADAGLAFRARGSAGMEDTIGADGPRRLIAFLKLLSDLAEAFEAGAVETLAAGNPVLRARSADASRLSKLQDYIEKSYAGGASLDGAADTLALTRTSFCRWVRGCTGLRFTDLLNDYRLTVAAMRLRDTDVPVAAVAADAGFGSLSYFNALFRRRFGMTPSQWRLNTGNA